MGRWIPLPCLYFTCEAPASSGPATEIEETADEAFYKSYKKLKKKKICPRKIANFHIYSAKSVKNNCKTKASHLCSVYICAGFMTNLNSRKKRPVKEELSALFTYFYATSIKI